MDWLLKIDPNVLIPTVLVLGTWLWKKVRGEKNQTVNQIVDSVIENFAHEILDRYTVGAGNTAEYLKRVRKYIEERIWEVLAKRGVPKNGVTVSLVNQATERWTAWVGNQVTQIRRSKGAER